MKPFYRRSRNHGTLARLVFSFLCTSLAGSTYGGFWHYCRSSVASMMGIHPNAPSIRLRQIGPLRGEGPTARLWAYDAFLTSVPGISLDEFDFILTNLPRGIKAMGLGHTAEARGATKRFGIDSYLWHADYEVNGALDIKVLYLAVNKLDVSPGDQRVFDRFPRVASLLKSSVEFDIMYGSEDWSLPGIPEQTRLDILETFYRAMAKKIALDLFSPEDGGRDRYLGFLLRYARAPFIVGHLSLENYYPRIYANRLKMLAEKTKNDDDGFVTRINNALERHGFSEQALE